MLTFSNLSSLTRIEAEIGRWALFIAGVSTATFQYRTDQGQQHTLVEGSAIAARDAVITHAFSKVNDLLADAAKHGVDVSAERKAWAQKRAQLLPKVDEPE